MPRVAIPVQQMSALAMLGSSSISQVFLPFADVTCMSKGFIVCLVYAELPAGGEVAAVDAAPDTTIGEFKGLVLETLRPDDDELTRRVSSVELVQGKKRLLDDAATLAESEVSADAGVVAVISKRLVKRRRKGDNESGDKAPIDLNDPDRPVLLEIPDGTTEICEGAFANCASVVSVTIPASVTKIGECAFIDCQSLTSLSIPKSVTRISSGMFFRCKSLTSLMIPDSVVEIARYGFSFCSALTRLIIPKSVTEIAELAFSDCCSLTSVTIPESVTAIGRAAFSDCSSLTSLAIPSSVTVIGDRAFYGCRSLEEMKIPPSVTAIGAGAFHGCTSLTKLSLPVSLQDRFPEVDLGQPPHCHVVFR